MNLILFMYVPLVSRMFHMHYTYVHVYICPMSDVYMYIALAAPPTPPTTRWAEELEERPKLGVLKELVSGGFGARSVGVRRKKMRRILTKLRGGVQQSCRWRWGDGEV